MVLWIERGERVFENMSREIHKIMNDTKVIHMISLRQMLTFVKMRDKDARLYLD